MRLTPPRLEELGALLIEHAARLSTLLDPDDAENPPTTPRR
jgi:hypothetical protein